MTDEVNIEEAIKIENRDEIEPVSKFIKNKDWESFFKKHYDSWSNELVKDLHNYFQPMFSLPSQEDVDAEFDHWYQQHLIRGLIFYSKSIVGKVKDKYSRPTKEIQSIVVALKENYEEPNDIDWHDIYLILSDECRNKSIATIYKGEN